MVKKLKRWLATVLAVAVMASSVVAGFAVDVSFANVSFAQYCTEMPGGYRFVFSDDYELAASSTASAADVYQVYKNAINDSSKVVLFSFYNLGGSRLTVAVLDAATLKVSYKTISGTSYIQFASSDCSYLTFIHSNHNTVQTGLHNSGLNFLFGSSIFIAQGSVPFVDSVRIINDISHFEILSETDFGAGAAHTLTVNYLYTEDTPASDSFTQSLASGAEYSIPSPEIEGYTPDTPLVSGTMPDEDLTINVFYSRAFYPLTIKYQYVDGRKASEDISFQYPLGFVYDVPSPEIEGYQPDKPTIAGEMPGEALEAVVTYTAIPYTLTVNYQYVGGGQAAPSYQEQLIIGTNYYVTSPVIEGYHPNQSAVSGVMPASDVVSTVTYREDSGGSSGPDPVGPGEGGESGDGDSGEGGSGSGYDPFIPSLPPFSGKDPFVVPDMPEYSGYDPFKIVGPPAYSGYDPFIVPRIPAFSGYDPFAMPNKGDIE